MKTQKIINLVNDDNMLLMTADYILAANRKTMDSINQILSKENKTDQEQLKNIYMHGELKNEL